MRHLAVFVAALSSAAGLCGGCAPLQSEADPALSAEARRVWAEVGGHPAVDVKAVPCVGSPAATWAADGPRMQVTMYVPVGAPAPLATVLMRYELSKVAFVHGDESLLSQLLWPVRFADAALHGPLSELNSLRAIVLPTPPDPARTRRDSVFENPADPSWSASAAKATAVRREGTASAPTPAPTLAVR